jgi:hypothetical protein
MKVASSTKKGIVTGNTLTVDGWQVAESLCLHLLQPAISRLAARRPVEKGNLVGATMSRGAGTPMTRVLRRN